MRYINRRFTYLLTSCDLSMHCSTASVINDMLLVKSKQTEIPTLCGEDILYMYFIIDHLYVFNSSLSLSSSSFILLCLLYSV